MEVEAEPPGPAVDKQEIATPTLEWQAGPSLQNCVDFTYIGSLDCWVCWTYDGDGIARLVALDQDGTVLSRVEAPVEAATSLHCSYVASCDALTVACGDVISLRSTHNGIIYLKSMLKRFAHEGIELSMAEARLLVEQATAAATAGAKPPSQFIAELREAIESAESSDSQVRHFSNVSHLNDFYSSGTRFTCQLQRQHDLRSKHSAK